MAGMRNVLLRFLLLLAVVGVARAELSLISDKLTMDALVASSAQWWQAQTGGLAHSEFVLDRVSAPIGMTGQLSRAVSFRASGDVSMLQPQDLYVDLQWRDSFRLRAGQFLLPLGMDAMTPPDSQKLPSSSFLASYAKPTGTRDVGILGSWAPGRFSVSAAVINGGGANLKDDNTSKDLCGRVTFKPLSAVDGILALRAYYGRPDTADTAWRTLAAEARLVHGPLEIQAEFQNLSAQHIRNNMAYLQAASDRGVLKPVGRLDLTLSNGGVSEWMIAGGLNLQPVSDHFRATLDCTYHKSYQGNWSVFGFDIRLQAWL
ncbi:MAG TPA: porin [bacterium]|nr:porin [bacterium]